MPSLCTFDLERDVIVVTGTGILTDDDAISVAKQVYRDPRFHPDMRGYCDFSEVTQWEVRREVLLALAANRKLSEKSRTAICATALAAFGMSRMYQALVQKGKISVFNDRAEALAWLNEGVPPEKWLT